MVALINVNDEGKVGLVVGLTPDLTRWFNGFDLVRRGAEALSEPPAPPPRASRPASAIGGG
jgi:hypothetical protein